MISRAILAGLIESSAPNTDFATPSKDARSIVAQRLAEQIRRFPHLDLSPLKVDTLDDRDASFAHAMYDIAVRRWLTIGGLIQLCLDKPLEIMEPKLRAVLMLGTVQLYFLDKVPTHSAVDESVELAKQWIRPGAGALTNAVLRKVALLRRMDETGHTLKRDTWKALDDEIPLATGEALVLSRSVLPETGPERVAAAVGLTPWFVKRLAEFHGGKAAAIAIAHHTLASPPTTLNAKYARSPLSQETLLDLTPVPNREGLFFYEGQHRDLAKLLAARRDIWVQDVSSTDAIESIRDFRPDVIADVCAGQGTKSRQLRAMFPDAMLIVSDTDPNRMRQLREIFGTDPGVRIVESKKLIEFAGKVDLVLLDVPCTNSGVLARRAEAAMRASQEQLDRLVGIQKQIVADSLPLLSPSGAILYSTCSIEREENHAIVEWAAKWHEFKIERLRQVLPAGLPGEEARSYRDGAFSAVLRWS